MPSVPDLMTRRSSRIPLERCYGTAQSACPLPSSDPESPAPPKDAPVAAALPGPRLKTARLRDAPSNTSNSARRPRPADQALAPDSRVQSPRAELRSLGAKRGAALAAQSPN